MGFEESIVPLMRSMQIVGLMPTGQLNIGSYDDDEKKRPNIALKHLIYPFVTLIISWFASIRLFTVFAFAPKTFVKDITYDVMFICLTIATAGIRTNYVYCHWRGNTWLKMLDFVAAGDFSDSKSTNQQPSKHPLYILAPNDDAQMTFQKKRLKRLEAMGRGFWIFIFLAGVLTISVFILRRDAFDTILQPFSYLCQNENNCYIGSLAFVTFLTLISSYTTIFGVILVLALTFELGNRFSDLHTWVSDHRMAYLSAAKVQTDREADSKASGIASENENVAVKLQITTVLDAHHHLLQGVRRLDKVARVTISCCMSFGFFSILVNVYQIAWGSSDWLQRALWAYWTMIAINLLFGFLIASAIMNKKAISVQESLFRMPFEAIAIPADGDERQTTLTLCLLFGQFETEPIALTYLGVLFLRTECIMGLMGGLMAYFLLLVEIAAGEKRGYSVGKAECGQT